ncbi:hypothetical protein ACOYW6_11540 [Parablastomonas sp. CN1-191]|uniref:hypothetical protein n=1 Tax=Parablastomonas sp. CN1-191 TaxID=3400908 RepID=UPI003BF8D04C
MADTMTDGAQVEQAGNAAPARWYDADWLRAWHEARSIVARVCPGRLDEFVHAFDVLRTPADFRPLRLPGLFGAEELAALRRSIRGIPQAAFEMHEAATFGRFVVHDHPEMTALQRTFVDRVGEWVGEPVEISYNFLSFYTRMGVCRPHIDAPSAKWTLDICIDQSDVWPIHFSKVVPWPDPHAPRAADWADAIKRDPALDFQTALLSPGDAVLFGGSSAWHYRDPLPGGDRRQFCDLLFMHFVPVGTVPLLRAGDWPELFGIPELQDVPGLDTAY